MVFTLTVSAVAASGILPGMTHRKSSGPKPYILQQWVTLQDLVITVAQFTLTLGY